MTDTTAPTLLGLTLPTTIDLSAGRANAFFGVHAQDESGSLGVREVRIEFSDPFFTDGTSVTSSMVFNMWTYDNFRDDTPSFASDTLVIGNPTRSGVHNIARVIVTDVAGNQARYDSAQLQALGLPTAMTVTGGITDDTPPTLVSLAMPERLTTSRFMLDDFVIQGIARDAGGAGPSRVLVTFDKPLNLFDGANDTLQTVVFAPGQSNINVGFTLGSSLSVRALPGIYHVASVQVVDAVGNVRAYSPPELQAMGIRTTLTVASDPASDPLPLVPDAVLALSMDDDGAELTVTPATWGAAPANRFELMMQRDGTAGGAVDVAVNGHASADITVLDDGRAVTATGQHVTGAGAGTGVAFSFGSVTPGTLASFTFVGFAINGVYHRDTAVQREIDYYRGTDAADTIENANFSDLVDGRGGLDTVRIRAQRDDYLDITPSGNGFSIYLRHGSERLLQNVERLAFDDMYVALDVDGAAGQVYRLYQAAFDRTPDLVGMGFWLSRMDAGIGLQVVADQFVASAEFVALTGAAAGNDDFVTALYDNVLHRQPDPLGLAYWVDVLERSALNRAEMLVAFSESPENVAQVIGVIEHGIPYVL